MSLRPLLERYGEAIEFDLWERGDNLREYLDPRVPHKPPRRLLVILERLPSTSHFVVARRDDPEVAIEVARRMREQRASGKGSRWRPPATEWSPHVELLASAVDRLGELLALTSALPVATDRNGKSIKRPKPPKQLARPETAIERAETLLAEQHVDEIIADVEASYVTADQYAAMVAEQEQYRGAPAASQEDQPGT